jgi:hypothetical protein
MKVDNPESWLNIKFTKNQVILIQNDVTRNPEFNPFTYVLQIKGHKTEHCRIHKPPLANHGLGMHSSSKEDKTKSNQHQCLHCSKTFKCRQNKEKHELHFHSDPGDAALVAASKAQILKYSVDLANQKRFKCSGCKRVFGHKQAAKVHIKRIHGKESDPVVIEYKTQENAKRRKYRSDIVKKTGVHSGSERGSADTGALSSASVGASSSASVGASSSASAVVVWTASPVVVWTASPVVVWTASPVGGEGGRCEKSGCDEVFKRSEHVVQHSVDRIGVDMRISRLSSLNMRQLSHPVRRRDSSPRSRGRERDSSHTLSDAPTAAPDHAAGSAPVLRRWNRLDVKSSCGVVWCGVWCEIQ